MERVRWYRRAERYFRLRSAGPDRQFGTGDDLHGWIEVRSGTVVEMTQTSAGPLAFEWSTIADQ